MSALPKAKRTDRLSDFRTNRRVLLLVALALPIGVLCAFVAKGLLWLIAVFTNLAFFQRFSVQEATPVSHQLGAWVILVPVAGAIVIGLMARYGSAKIRGHGIPEALEAILLGKSIITPRVAILKPLASALSIGTGGPFGAEGPIIMTGGAFGSLFAQFFKLTPAERKTLLVAGAASGMAAVFATPIAATLLAVELLLFEWKPRSFIPVAVAAIVGSLVRVPLLGAGPLFEVAPHPTTTVLGLSAALIVGVLVGLGSGLLTQFVYFCEDLFERLPIHWMWWPAIGGVVVGIGGWLDPRVFGVGYETIHSVLRGEVIGATLVGLIVVKSIVWSVGLGSGTSGGVLAPLIMIGGALGALLGQWMPGGDVSLFAMIGMAAMLSGTLHTPLTGILFLLELTHDLAALPALLVGSVAALCVTVLLMRRSILTEKLARRGQHIAREYSVDLFELMRVGDVMSNEPPTVLASCTVKQLSVQIADRSSVLGRRHAVLIVDEKGHLAGILTREDMLRALAADPTGETSVLDAGQAEAPVTYADAPLHDALHTMLRRSVGRLAVVDRADPRKIVGYLGRAEILGAQLKQHDDEEKRARGPLLANMRDTVRDTLHLNRGPDA